MSPRATPVLGPNLPLVERPALQRRMAGRWDHRLVTVRAGAGFGKTALLSQAVLDNRLAPRGVDVRIACRVGDDDPEVLRASLLRASAVLAPSGELAGAASGAPAVRRVADLVLGRAPEHVCFLVDDADHLGAGTAASAVLDELLDALPENGHVVVASRSAPPVATARWRAQGQLVEVDEADLVFDAADLAALAELRGRPGLPLEASGGWPALAELWLTPGGSGAVGEFLVEEALRGMPSDAAEVVELSTVVGAIDGALAGALLGRPVDLAALLRAVPLVETDGVWFRAHPIWREGTGGRHRTAGADDLRRRAAALLLERGEHERAFDLAVAGGEVALALDALAGACIEWFEVGDRPDLRRWVERLPAGAAEHPVALLAWACSSGPGAWEETVALVHRARAAFAEQGDAVLELATLTWFGVAAWQAGDLARVVEAIEALRSLAGRGDGPAAAVLDAVDAAVAFELAVDAGSALEASRAVQGIDLATLGQPMRSLLARFQATALLRHADPAVALARVEAVGRVVVPGVHLQLAVTRVWATWLAGRPLDAIEVLDDLAAEVAAAPPTGPTAIEDQATLAANAGLAAALLGRPVPSHWPRPGGAPHDLVVVRVLEALGRASEALAVPHHVDEASVAEALRADLGEHATATGRAMSAAVRAAGLVYVLLPEARPSLDAAPEGSGPARAVRAARALLDRRAGRAPAPDLGPAVLDPPLACTALPAPWAVELAVRTALAPSRPDAGPAGVDAVLPLVRWLGPAGLRALRRLVAGPDAEVAEAAAELARRLPGDGAARVLRLTGPAVVEVGGEVLDAPEWRRERVRALLALLCRTPTIGRAEAARRLWPELSDEAGANNLRVTLSYLHRVLEPGRAKGRPTVEVRATGNLLRFDGRPGWIVDVEEFDRLADHAARDEAANVPSVALRRYEEALGWYRGAYLEDVVASPEDEIERERLRSRFVRVATRAGALRLALGHVEDALRLAGRALGEDPWCEPALALVAAAHLEAGDRPAAVRALRRAEEVLDELGLPPGADLERVRRAIEASGRTRR